MCIRDSLDAGAEVHGAAHTGNDLARDYPVGDVAFLVNLQSAENGGVHVAAADEACLLYTSR